MKWIAVILVMLNVAAYLVGLKLDPDATQVASNAPFETVNEAAMSVIKPELRRVSTAAEAPKARSATPELVEDEITQLKIDNRGQVLTTGKHKPAQEKSVKVVATVEPSATEKSAIRVEPNPILQAQTEAQKEPLSVATKRVTPPVTRPAPEVKSAVTAEPKAQPKPAPEPGPAPKPKPVAKPKPKSKPAPDPGPVPAVVAQPEKAAPVPVATRREPLACYRLGPFDNKDALTAVRRKLKSQSVNFKLEEKTLPGDIKGVRVYVGGFSDAAALDQEKQRLKRMTVDNYEVSLNGDAVLQLGYFKSATGASKAQKLLTAKGIDAKVYTIYKSTRIESWLTLISAPRDKVKSLTLPKGVQAKEQSCP